MRTSEEAEFAPLSWQICQNIREPDYERGRPPTPWSDQVFAATTKVYLEKSARRVMPRLLRAHHEGFLTRPVTFNTISSFLEKEAATPILEDLVIRSSLPAVPFELIFAADSTGFAGNRFVKWQDIKYRGRAEHLWAKMHIMAGTSTHVEKSPFSRKAPAGGEGCGQGSTAGVRNQARAGWWATSRPSAASAVATICLALSPAMSYCPPWESWSIKTSGSVIWRIFKP